MYAILDVKCGECVSEYHIEAGSPDRICTETFAVYKPDTDEINVIQMKNPEPRNMLCLFGSEKSADDMCGMFNKFAGDNRYESVLVLINGDAVLNGNYKWFGAENPRYEDSPCIIRQWLVVVSEKKHEFVCALQTGKNGFPEGVLTSFNCASLFDSYESASRARAVCTAAGSDQEFTLGVMEIRRCGQASKK